MGERYAGRYELVDPIGEGATGAVWRAWDHRAHRFVAAKLLRQRDASALLRFVREQSLRVSHRHVAPPIGWAAEDLDVLLTMDLVAGGSVATLLGDYGRLPVPFAAVLLDQLLDALAAVHSAGLVHRDVKPGNLLLEATGTRRPVLRLGDFGIAAVRGAPPLTHHGIVLGTRGYLAPDAWAGAEPAPHHDLWSAGVVGWQMITGKPPSARPLAGLGDRPADVPESVWDWISVMCVPTAKGRFTDAVSARVALIRALDSAGLSAAVLAVGTSGQRNPLEVFDHLAELPPGWTPAGPGPGQPRTAPRPPHPAVNREHASALPVTRAPARRRRRPSRGMQIRLVAVAVLVVLAALAFQAARNSARSNGAEQSPATSGRAAPAGYLGVAITR